MNPLPTTRRVFTWFCLCSVNESTPKWKKIVFTIATYTGLAFAIVICMGSLAYFHRIISSNMEEALYTATQVISCLIITYLMIVALILRRKINGIFERLTVIYSECKNE